MWRSVLVPVIHSWGVSIGYEVWVEGEDEGELRYKANLCAIVHAVAAQGGRSFHYKGVL